MIYFLPFTKGDRENKAEPVGLEMGSRNEKEATANAVGNEDGIWL